MTSPDPLTPEERCQANLMVDMLAGAHERLDNRDAIGVPALNDDLLTPAEFEAIGLTAALVNVVCNRVIGRYSTATRDADIGEFVFHIHAIQKMIMGQAAARRYPTRFRLLGEVLR